MTKANKKRKRNDNHKRFDTKIFIIVAILFIFAIIIKIPSLEYLTRGDSLVYTKLTESLLQGDYSIKGEPHDLYPPGFPLLSLPFALFAGAYLGVKLSAIFWSAATIIIVFLFGLHLRFNTKTSILASLLVMLNPWFFYFNGTLPLSESASIFFLTTGLFLKYISRNKKSHKWFLLSGLLFGISIIIRFVSIFMVLPFAAESAYHLFKKREAIKNSAYNLLIFSPLAIWTIRNMLVIDSVRPKGYDILYSHWAYAPKMFFVFSFIAIPAVFMLLLIPIISSIRRYSRDKYWRLVILGAIMTIVAHIILSYNPNPDFLTMALSRTRYITPLLPIMTVFAFESLKKNDVKKRQTMKRIIIISLILSIGTTLLWNNGPIKDIADSIITTPNIYIQRASYRAQTVDWINENLPAGATLRGGFSEKHPDCDIFEINEYLKDHLREDIIYECVDYQNENLTCQNMKVGYHLVENYKICDNPIYHLNKRRDIYIFNISNRK